MNNIKDLEYDEIHEQELLLSEEDDFNESPPADIVAYNELRSCAELLRMNNMGQLIIQPDFQRDVVWSKPAQTRFIDSLIKQLPIPSLCISLDYKTQKRLIIDGLQRVSSIISFLSDKEWRLSPLDDIDPKISGKTNHYIKEKHSDLYERLENVTIPVTILRCDYSKKSHMNYLFTIFHRLNTGGTKLNNQEIRNCIFQGNFNEYLKKQVTSKGFQDLFGVSSSSYRFTQEELLLRIIAFHVKYEKYNGRLAKFLNDFMDDNKSANEVTLKEWQSLIEQTINIIYVKIFDSKPITGLNKTTIEGLFVGISKNIANLESKTASEVKALFEIFKNSVEFSHDNLKSGLSQKDKVIDRLNFAIATFGQ